MGKAIAIFNQKGGVGKTTTNINLSANLGKMGKKILVVDIDPQGNTTSGFGQASRYLENTIYDALLGDVDVDKCIMKSKYRNIDLIPADMQLAGAEIELTGMRTREFKLKILIDQIRDGYDYIFIDCPPSLGLLTLNALTAADGVLIPIQCEYYALEGVSQLMNTIGLIRNKLNPTLAIEGVLLSMFDKRTNLSVQVVEEVKEFFKEKVYETVIPRNVRLAEAPSYGLPITEYDPKSRGAEAYQLLAEEFLAMEKKGEA
ncbi:MAG: chromosome partitioning protein [Clostridiales bacterium]|nr:MAG: chromosome partitioning protein [Clostridiales bacterium]